MINSSDIASQLQITVWNGKNCFKMTRGSFSYRQKSSRHTHLQKSAITQTKQGCVVSFLAGRKHPEEYLEVTITDKDDLIRLSFAYKTADGTVKKDIPYNRFLISLPAYEQEHIYGCGETHALFDLKGQRIRIFVAEHQNAKRISSKIFRLKLSGGRYYRTLPFDKYESYYAQPTYVSSEKYFVHVDTSRFAQFDFRDGHTTTMHLQELGDIYIGRADSFDELSLKLANLLGFQRPLPDWLYDGAIVAVQRGCAVIDEKLEKAAKSGARICGVWSQDWCGCRKTQFGYQVMWNWSWDRELYADLPDKIKEWGSKGIKFLGYINPFFAIEGDLYEYASKHDYCVKDKEGNDYLVTITTFPAAMIDFTNPEAYEWYKSVIKENLIDLGMGGWMADFGEYLPVDCVLASGEDPEAIHNRWPAIWAQMNREAIEERGKEDEVFFFTRAGFTGTVANSAMMWTGDQHVDWSVDDGMPSVIPATLSLALSGFGITHSDVGGYTTFQPMTRSKELMFRWEEMNIFSPLYRFHEGNRPVHNVQAFDDEELLRQLAWASHLHAELKPYLIKAVQQTCEAALPVMRPLFYHYDEASAYTERTEYLLGRDVLVAPVLESGVTSRSVYLPDDEWVHIFTEQAYLGGTHTIEAPIGLPPVFVRKGAEDYDLIISAARKCQDILN